MKTAMQELIEMYESDLLRIQSKRKESDDLQLMTKAATLSAVITNLKGRLEKEKEQIIDAHTHAYLIGEDNITIESANEAGLRYYNQTYNQNK
jgi:hypothetical protein